jgi:hypothetical protein
MRAPSTYLFLCLLFIFLESNSQTLRRPIAACYLGLGAYSLQNHDVFSFTANQASLAQLKSGGAGVYGEKRFLLNELSNYIAVVGLPTTSGNFGLKASYFGSGQYNESQIGLAYARKLGNKIDIGAQFNYNGLNIAGYGDVSAISFEIGTILHVSERLNAGMHINNPVGGKFGKEQQEKLASVYTIGFGYDASDKFFISTAIEKEEDQPINVNAGMQYKFIPQVLARLGVSTATSTAWMGVGLSWKLFRVDVTAAYHPQLGISPGLLLLLNFKKNEN